MPWRLLAVSTALALAAAIATVVVLSDDDGSSSGKSSIELTPEGDGATDDTGSLTFTTFSGEVVELASLRGTPTVVNFFASTCVPCVKEMPAFQEVHESLGEQVSFLGLAVADRPDEAQALVKRTGVTYPTAQDRDASVIDALGGIVLPTTALLDADGTLLTTHVGELTADDLLALVADTFGITP